MKASKKFWILTALVICLFSFLTAAGSAAGETKTIQAGGHELTLSLNDSGTWTVVDANHNAVGGDLVIPSEVDGIAVTDIANQCFITCNSILTGTLTLPDSLLSIGDSAFSGCSKLTGDLIIPASCQYIGEHAFCSAYENGGTLTIAASTIGNSAFERTGFAQIFLADGVETIGDAAFYASQSLTGDLTIPASCRSVGKRAFGGTYNTGGTLTTAAASIGSDAFYGTGFSKVHLAEGVRSVDTNAFYNCTVTELEITSTQLETIGDYAFRGCSQLTGPITIPASVQYLGRYAFSGCSSLQGSVTIGATTIGDYAFHYDAKNFTLVLLDGVETIGNAAFRNSGVTGDLILPDSVTTIGDQAFYGCNSLTGELKLSASLETVGKEAFHSTSLQGTLSFPATLKLIGTKAFYSCNDLTGITFAETAAENCTIEDNAFYACTALTAVGQDSLVLPEGLVSIGNSAFSNVKSLTGGLVLPNSLVTIGEYAFVYCSGLNGSLKLPAALETVGGHAFQNCPFTGTLDLPETLTSIGDGAFSNCNFSGDLVIPDGVTNLGSDVFYQAFNDTENPGMLVLPADLTGIGDKAFSGCTGLTGTLSIPDTVTAIGASAFKGCTGFTELRLSKSLISVGAEAFSGCSNMTGSLYLGNAATLGASAFLNCSSLDGTLTLSESLTQIPASCFSGCSGLTGGLRIPDSVTEIGGSAFLNCSSLDETLTLSKALTQIPASCFSGCSGLTGGLQIPDSVTEIGDSAFLNCISLNGDLVLSGQLTSIGTNTFTNCIGLTGKPILPDTLTKLGAYAFQNCSSLTGKLDIPRSLTVLNNSVFRGCSGLTGKLVIPGSITTVGGGVFWGCSGFTGLSLSDGVTTIGMSAFEDCTGFTGDLILPDSVTSIGEAAFRGCTGLDGTLKLSAGTKTVSPVFSGSTNFTKLIIPDGIETIGSSAFKNFSKLTGDLIIPDSVTSIGTFAFSGCSGLNGKLELPENLQTISQNAFADCTGFTGDLIIPPGATKLGDYAFSSCEFGGTLMIPYGITEGSYSFLNCRFENVYFPNDYLSGYGLFKDAEITNIYYGGNSDDFPFTTTGINKLDVTVYSNSYPPQALTIKGNGSLSFRSGQTFTLEAFYYNSEVVADPAFTWSSNQPDIILIESSTQKMSSAGYTGTTTATFRALTEGTATITVSGPGSMTDTCTVTSVDHAELVFIPQSGQSAVEPMQMEPGDTMEVLFSYRCYGNAADDLEGIKWETLVNGQSNSEIVSLSIHEPVIESEDIATLTATVTAIGYGGPVEIRVSGPRSSSAHCTVVVPHETLTILYGDKTQPPEPEIIHFRQKIGEPFKFYVRYETALTDEAAVQEEIDNMIWTSATPDFFLDGVHNLDGTTVLKPEVTWTKVQDGIYELEAELEAGIESVTALKIETRNHASDQCIIFSTFDVDSYRAQLYDRTVDGEKLPEAALLDTYLYGDTPCQLIVEELHENLLYQGAVVSWETLKAIFTAVDNPSSLANYSVQQSDMYYALLLNILRGTMDASAGLNATAVTSFGSSVASGLQDTAAGFGVDPKNYSAVMNWMIPKQSAILQNTYVDKLDDLGVGEVGNLLSVGNVVFQSIDDYQTAMANRIVLLRTTDAMEHMLEVMLQECPASNNVLKDALTLCLEQVKKTNEELAYDAELKLIASVGRYGYQAAFDYVWDKLMDSVKLACPQVASLSAAYSASSTLCNSFLQTDDLLERYYMMKAYEEIRQVAQSAKQTLGSVWTASPSNTTAVEYLCALDVLYRINHLDAKLALDYTKQALEAQIIAGHPEQIIFYQDLFDSFTTYDTSLTNAYKAFQNMWYFYFQQDYPSSLMDLQYADLFTAMTGEKPKRIVVVSCPVNVYVYDSAGNMVAGVVNEKLTCQADDIAVSLSGTQKTIYFYSDARYTLEYEGYDIGTMNITDQTFDADGELIRTLNYYDLPVSPDASYTASGVDNLRSGSSYVAPSGDSVDHASYTAAVVNGLVQSDGPFTAQTSAYSGQSLQLMAKIPSGAIFTGWTSNLGTDMFADPSAWATTVRMPAGNVIITATYRYSPDDPPTDKLILTDQNDELLLTIPQSFFTAHISAPTTGAHGILACYDGTGKLVNVLTCDLSESSTGVCHFDVDNTSGLITQLRFFCLDSAYTPVQTEICLPAKAK